MPNTLIRELDRALVSCQSNEEFYDTVRCIIDKYNTQYEEDNVMGSMPPVRTGLEFVDDPIEMKTFGKLKELDPNGVDAHAGGAKLDAGKNQLGSILGGFSNALMAVGEVGSLGAQKYSLGGWTLVPEGKRRYTDAMLRHFFKENTDGLYDNDLPVLHAAQVAWNALARLEFILKELEPLPYDSLVSKESREAADRLMTASDKELSDAAE